MSKVETIKESLKFLVYKQIRQGSWGFSNGNDNEVSWNEVIEWLEQESVLDKKSIEPLTDIEQTIFIAAMFNEEGICEKVEKVCVDDSVDLVAVCRNIERKVKNTLWPTCEEKQEQTRDEKIIDAIDHAIKATDSQDDYGMGMRNGMRYVKYLIDGKEPQYESKRSDEEIKLGINLGDEVVDDFGAKGVVVGIDTYEGEIWLSLLMRNHKVPQLVTASRYKKTNRHFPQIIEVLEQMRRVNNEHNADMLTVTFDSSLNDEAGICVSRVVDGKVVVLKMELGEQADILYHLLTEQMTKAEIKAESEDKG